MRLYKDPKKQDDEKDRPDHKKVFCYGGNCFQFYKLMVNPDRFVDQYLLYFLSEWL